MKRDGNTKLKDNNLIKEKYNIRIKYWLIIEETPMELGIIQFHMNISNHKEVISKWI